MTDAKNTTEATQWCKEARDLVGTRRGKSKELKAARDLLKTVAEKLERQLTHLATLRPARFTEFNPRFLKLAGDVHEATQSTRNDKVLQTAAQGLNTLLGEVEAAIVMQTTLAADLAKFDKDFAAKQVNVAEAAGLRGARTPGSPVKTALDDAGELMTAAQAERDQAETDNTPANLVTANEKLAAVTPKLALAKTSAKTADKGAEAYLTAMKQWGKLKPQVQAALQELKGLPGAEKIARNLENAYNEAVGGIAQAPDGTWSGHVEAVEKLRQFEQSLTVGRETSANLLSRDLPSDVQSALQKATAELARHAELAPSYAAQAYRDDAKAAAQLGRADGPGAITRLDALRLLVKGEADRLTTEKADALTAQTRFDTAVAAMATLEVPSAQFGPYKLVGDLAVQGELAERQWAQAKIKLDSAAASMALMQAGFTTHGVAWKARKAELEDMVKQCIPLVGIPAVGQTALALRNEASEVLAAFVCRDLAAEIKRFDDARLDKKTLTVAMKDLLDAARSKKVPLGNEQAQADFIKALAKATGSVMEASEKTRGEMRKFFDEKGLDAAPRRLLQESWFAKTQLVEKAWQVFRNSASGDLKAVETALKASLDALKKHAADLGKLNLSKLKLEAAELAKAAATKNAEAAPARIQKAIDELLALGVDVSAEQQELADGGADLRDLSARLEAKWDQAMQAQANARKALMAKVTGEIDGPLKRAGLSEKYRKELEQASTDIKLMINTEDPDLLAVAQAMQERMKTQVAAIAAKPKLYAANKKALEDQAGRIGDLADKLPETYRRLKTALTDELVQAKHTDPTVMEKRVADFVKQVDAAYLAVAARDREVAVYREAKAKVRADFDKMKAATKTRVTEKAVAFEAFYEQRITEAKALKKVEGGLPKAMEILKALQAKLDQINDDDNPLAKLRELDAEEKHNQRLVIDLAQQFEREVSVFLSTTLPQAKAAAKAAEDGDTGLAKSLEGVASSARKIVSPYLKNLDRIPIGNQVAPDITKLKADFETARGMLADARRTAERLIQNPDTTNVSGPGLGESAVRDGLAKLTRKWNERTQAFAAAVRTVTGAIRSAAASDPPEDKANAEKAAKMIESQLGSLFRSESFASAFKVLMQIPPEDKPGKKTLAAQQLAARESALRVMRQAMADTANPLLMRLTDPSKNPFEAPTMRVATSGIATVLKEIQLQVLASA